MKIEYLVLQTFSESGPLAKVRSNKLNKTWETLQQALDELGKDGWDICTPIYGPTGAREQNGDHFCEAFLLKRHQ